MRDGKSSQTRTPAADVPALPAPKTGALLTIAAALALLILSLIAPASASAASPAGATSAEEWAQQRICAGQPADFNSNLGVVLDPAQPQRWDERRLLSAAFLIALLTGDEKGCKVPPHGVDIAGAWFREPVDLQGANISTQLRVRGSRFEGPVRLDRVRAEKLVSFAGSHFAQPLMMTEIVVRGSLFLGEGASFAKTVVLWGASIDGQLSFSGKSIEKAEVTPAATPNAKAAPAAPPLRTGFGGDLEMSGVRVGRILDLRDADAAQNVILDRARIDGDLRLSGARFDANLAMDSIKVGESVEAWGAVWGEQRPDGSCVARKEPATAEWQFYYADVGANVYLSGACLADLAVLNLVGSRIRGQLFLGSIDHYPANAWGRRSIMTLRNASIGKIQDLPSIRTSGPVSPDASVPLPLAPGTPMRESWPLRLELDGFTYASWDGLGRQERPTGDAGWRVIPPRDDHWLISWVARDHSYSRQPYEQLARVRTAQGRPDSGNDILFTSREIERCITAHGLSSDGIEGCVLQQSGIAAPAIEQQKSSPPASPANRTTIDTGAADESTGERLLNYGVLSATWLLNGYGYRPLWSLGWFAVLILIGTLLFRYRTDEGNRHSIWFATEYTFDTLLPAVNLCKDFESINIDSPIRYYFVVLKVLGYVFVATLLQFFYQIVGRSIV